MSKRCPSCGREMDEYETFWSCDECDEFIYRPGYEPDEDEEDDMPECCAACGGPYPQCMTSCKIFDD